jgi:hypothetical protein
MRNWLPAITHRRQAPQRAAQLKQKNRGRFHTRGGKIFRGGA